MVIYSDTYQNRTSYYPGVSHPALRLPLDACLSSARPHHLVLASVISTAMRYCTVCTVHVTLGIRLTPYNVFLRRKHLCDGVYGLARFKAANCSGYVHGFGFEAGSQFPQFSQFIAPGEGLARQSCVVDKVRRRTSRRLKWIRLLRRQLHHCFS